MTLVLLVYLIGVLPAFGEALTVLSAISFIAIVFAVFLFSVAQAEAYGEDSKKHAASRTKVLKLAWIPAILMLAACIIPSERTMYTMLTVYGAAEIAKTPAAQQIGNDAVDVIKELVAKARRELAEENKKAEK